MKTILVPTDFSKIAQNAIDYAVEIAKLTKAKLILFNVYNIPVVPSEIPTIIPMNELEEESINELKRIEKSIHKKHGEGIKIECKCNRGFPVDEINYYAEEHTIDLIIMGTEGAGYLTEKLMGNVTTSLIAKAKCPVLAINKNVKFKTINNIALACDYKEISNKSIIEPLIELVKLFKSHLHILNVVPELETVPSVSKTLEKIKFDHMFVGLNHTFHYSENEDVIDGINDFVDAAKIDLVVMVPRMHTGFQRFFFEPNTNRIIFHTRVPLLALHKC